MRKSFKKLRDGELSRAARPRKDGSYLHIIKCCDCGLAHAVQYELTAKRSLRFRAWRLNHKRLARNA